MRHFNFLLILALLILSVPYTTFREQEEQDIQSEEGDPLWKRLYNGPLYEIGNTLVEVSSGGYTILSRAYNASTMHKTATYSMLLHTDKDGDKIWSQRYDFNLGTGSLLEVKAGGYVLTGRGGQLIRIDSTGEILWNTTLGDLNRDNMNSIVEIDDGGFTLAGTAYVQERDDYDIWLVHTDYEGRVLWSRTYKFPGRDKGYAMITIQSGGYLIAGHLFGVNALLRMDNNGNILWMKQYDEGYITNVIESSSGGFVFTSWSSESLMLTSATETGLVNWKRQIPGLTFTCGILELPTMDFIVTGYQDGLWVSRIHHNGTQLWERIYDSGWFSSTKGIIQASSGVLVITGKIWSFIGSDRQNLDDLFIFSVYMNPHSTESNSHTHVLFSFIIALSGVSVLEIFLRKIYENNE